MLLVVEVLMGEILLQPMDNPKIKHTLACHPLNFGACALERDTSHSGHQWLEPITALYRFLWLVADAAH